MLEERDALQLFIGDLLGHRGLILCQPVLGCEDGMGLVVGEEVANHLRAFCYEESLTTAELLLFQLTDEFDLILTYCH